MRDQTSRRLKRDSDRLLQVAGTFAFEEDQHTVNLRRFNLVHQRSSNLEIAKYWQSLNFGKVKDETLPSGEPILEFSFDKRGRVAIKRLLSRIERAECWRRLRQNGWIMIAAIAGVIAAVAACASAYFSYLSLSSK